MKHFPDIWTFFLWTSKAKRPRTYSSMCSLLKWTELDEVVLWLPGTLLSSLGCCRLLEKWAAVFEILVIFLSSLSGVDPLKASQVFGLVPLHLLHRGCLTLTQLLRPGRETHTDCPLLVRTDCVFDLGDKRVAHAICCWSNPTWPFCYCFAVACPSPCVSLLWWSCGDHKRPN